MNELNEFELTKEAESIKARIAFEQEKIVKAQSLYKRLDSFTSELIVKTIMLITLLFFTIGFMFGYILIGIYHLADNLLFEFIITMAILSVSAIFNLYGNLQKIPINILGERFLNYIKDISFLADSFRNSLNKDDTFKWAFKNKVGVYISNINNDIDKLNERLKRIAKDMETLKSQRLSNMAKSI